MIIGLDHVQLAMPRGREEAARSFYAGLLGMAELPKPPVLAARGGCWFASGTAVLHLGVEEPFAAARKAHPALLVDDLDGLEAALTGAGHQCVRSDGEIPGVRRFHTHDPFGNRVEFQQALPLMAQKVDVWAHRGVPKRPPSLVPCSGRAPALQFGGAYRAVCLHAEYVNADQVATLRALMNGSRWLEQARLLGRALRTTPRSAGGLLVVGTPGYEPWHMTAHLDDESRLSGVAELAPTLVRWSPPPGAPPHLSVGLARLEAARRGETLFVVAEDTAPVPLLERVNDARKTGATILALDSDDPELDALAHESLAVPESLSFDAGQHLVSAAAGEAAAAARRGLRQRLARFLDTVAGPSA